MNVSSMVMARRRLAAIAAVTAAGLFAFFTSESPAGAHRAQRHHVGHLLADGDTTTPIKHVVVIIGENHTFDNVFATYQPPAGQHVMNLLSEGIVTASGAPGPNVGKAVQQQATDTTSYQLDPTRTGAYATLPQPNTTYVPQACSGQEGNVADARFPANLPNAPYQITKYVPYFDDHSAYSQYGTCEFEGAFVGDPIHRFYQMYQQVSHGTSDLFTWVHETAGDTNGDPLPLPLTPQSTDQGALDMGFYNMAQGDVPVLNLLAHHYAMSDNYHQAVMGGTGANHIALGTGAAAYYQDANGNAVAPPAGEIENPNPQPGTNNTYAQDGYGKAGTTDGGSYSNCSDHTAPGVSSVFDYLDALPYKVAHLCAPDHYYLLNNYNPGYNVDGTLNTSTFTVPPQHDLPTIGDELSAHGISWAYYGEGYDNGTPGPNYCGICDPMQYSSSIMTNPTLRANTEHGLEDFDAAATNGTLPAVSFLKPGDDDGHPGYSTLAAFESFVTHAIDEVQNNPDLWKSTAIFVTFDEGGGYYDSGYIQPISFFGDGTRVPMIVISPYAKPGYVSHTYTDHVSILKFIERNWGLSALSKTSLDNLPNPKTSGTNPYVPTNRPAIGDMFDCFDFDHPQASTVSIHLKGGSQTSRHVEAIPELSR
jgi:phospholipase C